MQAAPTTHVNDLRPTTVSPLDLDEPDEDEDDEDVVEEDEEAAVEVAGVRAVVELFSGVVSVDPSVVVEAVTPPGQRLPRLDLGRMIYT